MSARVTVQGKVNRSATVKSIGRTYQSMPQHWPDTPAHPPAERRKNFLDDLSNSGRPFDYMVKAGQPARQKVIPPGDTLREKFANRVSIPRHPVRLVSRAAPRTRRLETFQAPRAVQALK
jgi:hypothetical protein